MYKMIKSSLEYSTIKLVDLKKYEPQILKIVEKFENDLSDESEFTGWYDYPVKVSSKYIQKIYSAANSIRNNSDVFVVCGIGGSYLGARAVIDALKGFKTDIEIIYMGNTFDEKYIKDCLDYLKTKEFSVNVISKSGSTLETAISFRLLKSLLEEKYGNHYNERICVTTDPEDSILLNMAQANGYTIFDIPKNIGGRYSVFTSVGLLPLAVAGVDIEKFIDGAKQANEHVQSKSIETNIAFQYAAYRYSQYNKNVVAEMFVTYTPYLTMISEWWKQLFGESEGKNGKGLLPTSAVFSTDLHSLGQYIQQGARCMFLTQLKIEGVGNIKITNESKNEDEINYLSELTLNDINKKAQEGTNIAHYSIGKVDHFTFSMKEINECTIGYMLYLFMYACMISANLLEVNPFDQPGVEYYKKEMKKILKNKKVL